MADINKQPPRYLLRKHTILSLVTPSDSFLEIGPGNLELSFALLENRIFSQGTAVDFNEDVIKFYDARESTKKSSLNVEIGDFLEITDGKTYDAVFACEVMEHIEDDLLFLKKINPLLKPNGQLVVSVPARMKFWSFHDEIVGHCRRYEKGAVIQLFKDAGFTKTKVLSYGFPLINFFSKIRILNAKLQNRSRAEWDKTKQTKESSYGQLPNWMSPLTAISNDFVFKLLTKLTSVFNSYDLAEGYLIIARK